MTRTIALLVLLLTSSASRAWGEYNVTLRWDPPSTYTDGSPAFPEDIGGYVLHYGTASQQYPETLAVGNVTIALLPGLADGIPYYVVATVYDTAGVSSGFSVPEVVTQPPPLPVPVPTPPPTVILTAPADNTTVPRKSAVVLTASATGPNGVSSVAFFINGVVQCTATLSPYACLWQVPAPPRRTYTLQAKAFDTQAQMGQSQLLTVQSSR